MTTEIISAIFEGMSYAILQERSNEVFCVVDIKDNAITIDLNHIHTFIFHHAQEDEGGGIIVDERLFHTQTMFCSLFNIPKLKKELLLFLNSVANEREADYLTAAQYKSELEEID